MATMETKRNRKIAVLVVVILVLAIGVVIVLKENMRKSAQSVSGVEVSSLEADEGTPQSVLDRIEEKESEFLEAKKQAEEVALKESSESENLESKEQESNDLDSQALESASVTEGSTDPVEASASETAKEETQSASGENTDSTEGEANSAGKKKTGKETAVDVGTGSAPDTRVIDFEGLQSKKNAHIYAWVSVPGTNVDYPVLRHPTDDGYYLYHNLNGSSGYPGCIYTENWNSKDWTDPVTVLYGHDMRSTGTMFHQLHKFEKQDFFDKNQYIYIYTPDKTLKYWIFATYVHSNEHLLYNHNFGDKKEFDSFFGTVLASAGGVNHVRDGVTITSDSKIITLSTCIKNKPNNRYLIFGVLQ